MVLSTVRNRTAAAAGGGARGVIFMTSLRAIMCSTRKQTSTWKFTREVLQRRIARHDTSMRRRSHRSHIGGAPSHGRQRFLGCITALVVALIGANGGERSVFSIRRPFLLPSVTVAINHAASLTWWTRTWMAAFGASVRTKRPSRPTTRLSTTSCWEEWCGGWLEYFSTITEKRLDPIRFG